jgi:hypothetical protein
MAPAQITGSSSSYARKYAMNGLFNIDDTKDDDFNNTHGKDNKPKKPHQPTPPKYNNEEEMFKQGIQAWVNSFLKGFDKPENAPFKIEVLQNICDHFKVDSMDDIPSVVKTQEKHQKLISLAKTEFNAVKALHENKGEF